MADFQVRRAAIPGWIYVLGNPSVPTMCKISGADRRTAHHGHELATQDKANASFVVVRRHAVKDWISVEQAVGRMLNDHRLPQPELFAVSPQEASRAIRAASKERGRRWMPSILPRRRRSKNTTITTTIRQRYIIRWIHHGTNWLPALLLVVVAAIVVAVARPDIPEWMPNAIAKTMRRLEGLH
jgi:hypothetical protein